MIFHPALVTVNIAEREREVARRRLLRESRASRGRRESRRRLRLRDLFRHPRPATSSPRPAGGLRP